MRMKMMIMKTQDMKKMKMIMMTMMRIIIPAHAVAVAREDQEEDLAA